MSHRTYPTFVDPVTTFYSHADSERTTGRPTTRTPDKASTPDKHPFFKALDEGRFDQVRRAVASDPTCIHMVGRQDASPTRRLAPISYALANCRRWNALSAHIRRTGTGMGPYDKIELSYRERLSSMNAILSWLLMTHPTIEIPINYPLHTAFVCRLHDFAERLLQRAPEYARQQNAHGKTPLHIVCTLLSGTPLADVARHVHMLAKAGTDVCVQDANGNTAFHILMSSLQKPVSSYGLIRRLGPRGNLETSTPIIDALLLHGASLSARNHKGMTPLDIAMHAGLDYMRIAQRAVTLRNRICRQQEGREGAHSQKSCSSFDVKQLNTGGHVTGLFGPLPDDVIAKIISFLSPYDAVFGIGATCSGLRCLVTSEFLWTHLELARCLQMMRHSVRQNMASDLSA